MIIDVVVDVVCPWCFVGKRQLDKAVKDQSGAVTQINYLPYELNPIAPEEGVDRKALYARKFEGREAEHKASLAQLQELGEALGIKFNFDIETRIANTVDAHRVIRWAGGFEKSNPKAHAGAQSKLVDLMMQAYFEKGQFLGDKDFLADTAASVGMDRKIVADLLASNRDVEHVKADAGRALQMGVQGVPFYIFDRKAGISGAQGEEALAKSIAFYAKTQT